MFANIAILLIFGWIDYVTGYEIGFFIFYFHPRVDRRLVRREKAGIAMACASAVCWYLADRMTTTPTPALPCLLETFARYVSFLTRR